MSKTQHIICILWITIGLMAIATQAGPVDENEIKKGRECKTFCDRCGCIGFYCGEECICECNPGKNSDDTECIAAIQAKAKESNTPYEILIQGPSSNRFLRNALQFDQSNQQTCSAPTEYGRTKRSTVVIYKPVAEDSNVDGFCEKPLKKETEAPLQHDFRGKRSIPVDSWFTDFSNTLVKPAPIPGVPVNGEEIEEPVEEPQKENTSVEDSEEDIFIPKKTRGFKKENKHALNIGEDDSLVEGIRKTFNKISNKALKAVERNTSVKKIRGAISNLLTTTTEEPDKSTDSLSPTQRFLSKIRGKLFQPFDIDGEFET